MQTRALVASLLLTVLALISTNGTAAAARASVTVVRAVSELPEGFRPPGGMRLVDTVDAAWRIWP